MTSKTDLSNVRMTVSLISGMLSAFTLMLIAASLCPERNMTDPVKGEMSPTVTSSLFSPVGRRLQKTTA